MKTTGWIAWDTDYPDEGMCVVWGRTKEEAIAAACRDLGYDLAELAKLKIGPCDAVTVVRSELLDGYASWNLPAEVEWAAFDALEERMRQAVARERERRAEMARTAGARLAAAAAKAPRGQA